MSVTSSKINSWLDWFTSRESALVVDKQNLENLFKTFHSTVSKSKFLERISKHSETVFLFKVNFGSGRVNLLHHLIA